MHKAEWLKEAIDATEVVYKRIGSGFTFTTDDIWAELESRNIPHPLEPRWMGDLTRLLRKDKLIVSDGVQKTTRPSRNKGYITIWRFL